MDYWSLLKKEYKKSILNMLFIIAVWITSFWYRGELTPSVVIGIIIGSFLGLYIKSYAIHIGWATEYAYPEERLFLQEIRHLANRCKNKLLNLYK